MRPFRHLPILAINTAVLLLPSLARSAEPLQIQLPILCEVARNCFIQNYVDHHTSAGARDYTCGTLTYDGHDGIDFRLLSLQAMKNGVRVVAAAGGRVTRVRDGMADVSIRQTNAPSIKGQECGNGVLIEHPDQWQTQYCHLAQGSVVVTPGQNVPAGEVLGHVGLSGKTEFPHLHFTVRYRGNAVDPFAFGSPDGACSGGVSLWESSVKQSLSYQAASVLNSGFAAGPVTMDGMETGDIRQLVPEPTSSALVAFVRTIGLQAGDVQRITILDPTGQVLVDNSAEPLDRNKAQSLMFAGKKRSSGLWPLGRYQAMYSVQRHDAVLIKHHFEMGF